MLLQERHELRQGVPVKKESMPLKSRIAELARMNTNSSKMTLFENPINISLIPRMAPNQQLKKGDRSCKFL